MRSSLPTWVGGAWGIAAAAMAVSQFVTAAPFQPAAVFAAAGITLVTSGPMLVVAWGLAILRSPFAGTLGVVLGGLTAAGVITNSVALAQAPPVGSLVAGVAGLLLGIGAWLARVEIVREPSG